MCLPSIRRFQILFAILVMLVTGAYAQLAESPHAVRNDVPQEGTEVLVFRHQKLHQGGHEAYFRLSREGVWPWFEKMGIIKIS